MVTTLSKAASSQKPKAKKSSLVNFNNHGKGGIRKTSVNENHFELSRITVNNRVIQPKLKVNKPNDKYEQEADRIAEQVLQMPSDNSFDHISAGADSIQRKCANCEEEDQLQMKALEKTSDKSIQRQEEEEEEELQMKEKSAASQDFGISSTMLSGSDGSLMSDGLRGFFEPRFGADFSNVRIHSDKQSEKLSDRIGARAFTYGSDIYFNRNEYKPDSIDGKRLLSHELTHVLQQTGSTKTIQRYAIVGGERVSDDGKMVVDDHTKDAWALESDIDKSNDILSSISSERTLKKTATKRKVKVPSGTAEHELTKYEIDVPNLKKNCGRAALQMLGHNVTGEREYVGVTNKRTTQEFTNTIAYHGDDQAPGGVLSTTEEISTEIYQKIFSEQEGKTLTRNQALNEWDALSASKKARYSKIYGINEFAVPKVGQAITMGTEFDMPGFKSDSQLGRPNSTWNFHFGTPVITSGHDYTTAENFTGSSHDYYFSMFGPHTKSQSWYDEQKGAGFGNKYTAMVVQHPETLTGETNRNNVKLVLSPEKFVKDGSGVKTRLSSGTGVKIIRRGMNWMKVEVTSGGDTGKIGWMLNKYFKDV